MRDTGRAGRRAVRWCEMEPGLARWCISVMGPRMWLALAAILVLAALPARATATSEGRCAVTLPNLVADPDAGFSAYAFNYGNARIRAHLNWSDGVLRAGRLPGGGSVAIVNPDGSIYAKLGWWRGVPGRFTITGRRIDRAAPRLRVSHHVASYPTIGFIPSGLTFPTTGCWRVPHVRASVVSPSWFLSPSESPTGASPRERHSHASSNGW